MSCKKIQFLEQVIESKIVKLLERASSNASFLEDATGPGRRLLIMGWCQLGSRQATQRAAQIADDGDSVVILAIILSFVHHLQRPPPQQRYYNYYCNLCVEILSTRLDATGQTWGLETFSESVATRATTTTAERG
jgi:hypothetical protein